MAYVLGFIAADGSIIKNRRGAHFLEVETIDRDLLENIRRLVGSNHKIGVRNRSKNWQTTYRLQIGSKMMFNDLVGLEIVPNKVKRLRMPKVPRKYLAHFIRGYFDGDSSVGFYTFRRPKRKSPIRVLVTRFTSSSKGLLRDIGHILYTAIGVRLKKPVSRQDKSFELQYSINDSRKIYRFLYRSKSALFLKKKVIFEKYLGT